MMKAYGIFIIGIIYAFAMAIIIAYSADTATDHLSRGARMECSHV